MIVIKFKIVFLKISLLLKKFQFKTKVIKPSTKTPHFIKNHNTNNTLPLIPIKSTLISTDFKLQSHKPKTIDPRKHDLESKNIM